MHGLIITPGTSQACQTLSASHFPLPCYINQQRCLPDPGAEVRASRSRTPLSSPAMGSPRASWRVPADWRRCPILILGRIWRCSAGTGREGTNRAAVGQALKTRLRSRAPAWDAEFATRRVQHGTVACRWITSDKRLAIRRHNTDPE